MRIQGVKWGNSRWPAPNDPGVQSVNTLPTPTKQPGTHAGHFWPPSPGQIIWGERQRSEPTTQPPGLVTEALFKTPPSPKPKRAPRKKLAATPGGSLPLTTPPQTPRRKAIPKGSLLSMDAFTLGRTSAGKVMCRYGATHNPGVIRKIIQLYPGGLGPVENAFHQEQVGGRCMLHAGNNLRLTGDEYYASTPGRRAHHTLREVVKVGDMAAAAKKLNAAVTHCARKNILTGSSNCI